MEEVCFATGSIGGLPSVEQLGDCDVDGPAQHDVRSGVGDNSIPYSKAGLTGTGFTSENGVRSNSFRWLMQKKNKP